MPDRGLQEGLHPSTWVDRADPSCTLGAVIGGCGAEPEAGPDGPLCASADSTASTGWWAMTRR